MIKVAVVGPESTGKSELTQVLAEHYGIDWVREYSRVFLTNLDRPYIEEDLVAITQGQLKSQLEAIGQGGDLVLFDTDLLVMKVWALFKYGRVDPVIANEWEANLADLYLLTDTDIPYEDDPLRENPNDRPELFKVYENELKTIGANYKVIKGSREERLSQAIAAINNIG